MKMLLLMREDVNVVIVMVAISVIVVVMISFVCVQPIIVATFL